VPEQYQKWMVEIEEAFLKMEEEKNKQDEVELGMIKELEQNPDDLEKKFELAVYLFEQKEKNKQAIDILLEIV